MGAKCVVRRSFMSLWVRFEIIEEDFMKQIVMADETKNHKIKRENFDRSSDLKEALQGVAVQVEKPERRVGKNLSKRKYIFSWGAGF